MNKVLTLILVALLVFAVASPLFAGGQREGAAERPIVLVGGTMLPEGHVFDQTLNVFKDRLMEYYDGPLQVELHHSGTLGTEMDAIEYMIQGVAVDFYIVSPAWIANWDRTAPFIDAPFIFRDVDHWEKSLQADVFAPIAESMQEKGLRFLGYGGGGTRHIISRKPVRSISEFPDLRMRVQGSPLHQEVFSATGIDATPLDYMEVYNAIGTGVLDALENEPAGLESMRFYEVAPYYILTSHQIVTRILAMSEKKFQSLPAELQDAVVRAAQDAAEFHRTTEVAMGDDVVDDLVRNHGLQVIEFDNTEMRNRALPVVENYAREVGATEIFRSINAIQ